MKILSKEKVIKFEEVIKKKNGVISEIKKEKLTKEEKIGLISLAIKKAVKIKTYVRN